MKILITGGSGCLGEYLNPILSAKNDILTLYHNNPGNCTLFNSQKLDITDEKALEEVFNSFSPEIVIHTAAVSSVQAASVLPAKTVYRVNVSATGNIAALCNKHGAKLIYTSTDLVYAGYRGSMLKEDAKLIPVSLYAETKLMGEQKITATFDDYIILRTALLFGFTKYASAPTYFQEIYNKMKTGEKVKLFTDQFRTPLSLIEAAKVIEQLCSMDIKKEIINLGGPERLSRAELGEKLCDAAGLDKTLIEKISASDIPGYTNVADVSMSTEKLTSYGIQLLDTTESIKMSLSELKQIGSMQ